MALKAARRPCWLAVCDRCGEGDDVDYGGCCHHANRASAVDVLVSTDWKVGADGTVLCPECFDAARSEIACPHGAGCTGGGCGRCPTDEAVLAHAKSRKQVDA